MTHIVSVEELANRLIDAANGRSDERIICVVGPNGAGKSRLLEQLKKTIDKKQSETASVILPATRDYPVAYEFRSHYSDVDWTAVDAFEQISIAQRNNNIRQTANYYTTTGALGHLQRIAPTDNTNNARYREELLQWALRDDCFARPKPEKPASIRASILEPLSRITKRKIVHKSDFTGEVLSDDDFGIQLKDRVVSLNEFSDGERQAFITAVFLLKPANKSYVYLIDEPELHLNDARAAELWGEIEATADGQPFLYATHNMSFATRDEIDVLLSIDMDGELRQIDKDQMLPSASVRELVGARIRILRNKRPIVFCEDSLTASFLDDLLNGLPVQTIALAGRSKVFSAARQEPAWREIMTDPLPICGVIDRDEMEDEQVVKTERQNIVVLPFNEMESFFTRYDVFSHMMARLAAEDRDIDAAYDTIVQNATRSLLGRAADKHKDRACYEWSAKAEIKIFPWELQGVEIVSLEELKLSITKRLTALIQCSSDKNYDLVMKMYPGKEMYKQFYAQVPQAIGVNMHIDPAAQYRSFRNDRDLLSSVLNLPDFTELRLKIAAKLML